MPRRPGHPIKTPGRTSVVSEAARQPPTYRSYDRKILMAALARWRFNQDAKTDFSCFGSSRTATDVPQLRQKNSDGGLGALAIQSRRQDRLQLFRKQPDSHRRTAATTEKF